jgi:Flp pilus assembly protein TadB
MDMQMRTADNLQGQLAGMAQRIGPVLTAIVAALLIIVGVLVINHPELLSWVVGIILMLGGVGLLASLATALTPAR